MHRFPLQMQHIASARPASQTSAADIIIPILMMVGALVVLGAVLLTLRRHILSGDTESPGEGLSLHDLRTLRDQGAISEDEYERMRATIIPTKTEIHPDVAALKAPRQEQQGGEKAEDPPGEPRPND